MTRHLRTLIKAVAVPAGVLTLALGLAACSSNSAEPTVTPSADAVILDVRSPGEAEAGMLEGAQLLDFNAGEVTAAIPNLDPEAEYLVYCRSGNRAGQAIALMEQAGFTNVTNLGSLEQAAQATGIAIVIP